MSLPAFPPGECFSTASAHVFVHKPPYDGCGYRVWFRAEDQYFRIGEFDSDQLEEAILHANLFITALRKFKSQEDV